MPRNAHFTPDHAPLTHHKSLEAEENRTTGPLFFLNPTRARFCHTDITPAPTGFNDKKTPARYTQPQNVAFEWTSRNNRKGRHALRVEDSASPTTPSGFVAPTSTSKPLPILRNIWGMFVEYPYWDVSWLVAWWFTWGSIVWVINAFFVWLPLVRPEMEFSTEIAIGGGVTAFIGASMFEIGSVLLMIEAFNENRAGCFGWQFERLFLSGSNGSKQDLDIEEGKAIRLKPDTDHCTHHHPNRKNLVGKGRTEKAAIQADSETMDENSVSGSTDRSWVWFPTMNELRTHYLREIGFLACFSQFIGASIFWIAGLTGLPNIIPKGDQPLLDGIYWAPQVVGGTGFIISGFLFMLETQKTWWKPAWGVLGWWIGFWNLIGAFGFTICGAFGYSTNSGIEFESALATFWGSWAFLIASVLQYYESLEKHPVTTIKPRAN
ncbi:uncharacterized protein STEHIDRAFT_103768 [Stereum hirsutum FP-91666 SS1]|uniref:uncharacterized protein n=1 Tax=Stereum hirsutum (strain FP-91666) TaxID=721885 RepID=UPI00044496ED|nr:uncharacterized protein STEHIDRAFT_103768 [Stereum hirsutum FP-91666 SS1]EIM81365.1 hypothetical protein STEHIDRAFT_103768 [Stereum hirsutum FP-91666 SS1]